MSRKRIIVIAVVALLALILILQNTQTVDTKLLFITVSMPRALLLMVTLLAGFLIGLVLPLRASRKKQAEKGDRTEDQGS